MSRVYFGLSSTEGDRLGHLIRGVQMLRSYGREADIDEYSSVVDVVLRAEEPPAYICVIGGETEATFDALRGICRETEWALGKPAEDPKMGNDGGKRTQSPQLDTLSVVVLQYDQRRPGNPPKVFDTVRAGRLEPGMTLAMPADEFRKLCDWGQVTIGDEGGVIGEWPSATGR